MYQVQILLDVVQKYVYVKHIIPTVSIDIFGSFQPRVLFGLAVFVYVSVINPNIIKCFTHSVRDRCFGVYVYGTYLMKNKEARNTPCLF